MYESFILRNLFSTTCHEIMASANVSVNDNTVMVVTDTLGIVAAMDCCMGKA